MDDYGYYNSYDAARINREALQDYLDFHKANEEEVIELLNAFMPKYRELKEEYYTLPAGKIKLAKKHIGEKTNILYQLADSMSIESARYIAHSFYVNHYLTDVENKIDNLERLYSQNRFNAILSELNIPTNKIKIEISEQTDKICLVMGKNAVETNKKDFIYQCLFKSFPAAHTSREKAERFQTHYLKSAEKIKRSASITLSLIKDLQDNENKLKTEAKSQIEKENYALYMVKYNKFKAEFAKTAENSIFAYIKKAPDSKLKKAIKKSLTNAQKDEISKKSENQDLVSPATLVKLLADIDAGLVNLGEGKGNSADANSNKGME